MSNFDRFIYGIPDGPILPTFTPNAPPQLAAADMPVALDPSDSSEEVIDLDYIIIERPPTKIVREFFQENLKGILSEEAKLFS